MKVNLFRVLALLVVFSMLTTAFISPAAAASLNGDGPTDGATIKGTPVTKSVAGEIRGATGPAKYIVVFEEPALASYRGGIEGLAATNPQVRGEKRLAVDSADSKAYVAYLEGKQAEFLAAVEKDFGRTIEKQASFKYALNGMLLVLTPDEALAIANLPGVRLVQREQIEQLLTDAGPYLIDADELWSGDGTPSGIGTEGEGIIAGIIDSGLNFDHPSFADPGPVDSYDHPAPPKYYGVCDMTDPQYDEDYKDLCNDKVIGAYTFTDPAQDTPSPEDNNGHGSHTASTVAGNRLLVEFDGVPNIAMSGVAPHAQLLILDSCYPTSTGGSCAGGDLVEAVDKIAELGFVDVVNYSISGGVDPAQDPVEYGFLGLVDAGVYVAASAGNSGPAAATVAHLSPWVSTTGASTHGRVFAQLTSITGPAPVDAALVGMDAAPSSSPIPFDMTNVPLKFHADNLNGCTAFPAGYFAGSVGFVQRGDCAFSVKATNIANAGGIGMLAYNNAGGPPIAMGGLTAATIPAVMISLNKGTLVKSWLTAHPGDTTLTVDGDLSAVINNDYADIMAGFSSQGPTVAFDVLKPDITGPGVNILAAVADSTLPPSPDIELDLYQGTSMSSPHNAGSGALIKALHPTWSPSAIKSAIMLTADNEGILAPNGVTPAGPLNMGSGRISLGMAGLTGLVMEESTADYFNSVYGTGVDVHDLNIPSMYDSACVVNCSWQRTFTSVATVPATYTAVVDAPAGMTVTVTPPSFTIAPGASQTVTFTADVSGLDVDVWAFATVSFETDAQHPGAGAPTELLNQGFEDTVFPPTDWAIYNVDGGGTNWQRDTVYFKTGIASAKHNYSCAGAQEGWLVSPQIAVPAASATSLTFHQRGDWTADLLYHGILVSTDSGLPADGDFVEILQPAAPPEDVWTTTPISVDLSSYAGQNIYVAFKYEGNCDDSWWIDDVKVTSVSTTGEPVSDVHVPMAILPVVSALPGRVEIEADANTGVYTLEDNYAGIEITDFTVSASGLTLGLLEVQEIPEDPTPANAYNADGSYFVSFDVPAGTRRLVARIVEAESLDVDLFMGRGTTLGANVVCTSATGAVLEYCDVLNPVAGTYWVAVQNFDGSASQPDMIALSYAAVPNTASTNLTVTADPDAATVGTPYDLDIAWNEPTMDGFEYWYGIFDAGSDPANPDNLGTVEVDLFRNPDSAAFDTTPDALTETLPLDGMGDQTLTIHNIGDLPGDFTIAEAPQSTLLTENFEGGVMPPAGGWETFHRGATTRQWALTNNPVYVYEGTYAAWVNYDGSLASDEWLVSPLLDLTNAVNPMLSFMAMSDTEYPTATMKVWATDAAGDPLTTEPLWDLVEDETWPTWAYRPIMLDLSAFEGQSIRIAWQYVGLDGESFGLDLVTVTGSLDVPWLSVTPMAGSIVGDGALDVTVSFDATGLAAGTYTTDLQVIDEMGEAIEVPVTLNVLENEPPVAVADSYTMDEDTVLMVTAPGVLGNDTDADSDPLTAELVMAPATGTLVLNADGSFTYTPPADYFGVVTFTYRADDGVFYSDPVTVTITVSDVPEEQYLFLPAIMK